MTYQGLPVRSHADRIVHRVADLLRTSPHGLSEWCGGRIVVLADLYTIPDLPWPYITVATDHSTWTLKIGARAERRGGVVIRLRWDEQLMLLAPGESSSMALYEAVLRTLAADGARVLLPVAPEPGAKAWGILREVTPLYWSSVVVEQQQGDEEPPVVVTDTGRELAIEVAYDYDVDLDTGHPPGLTDDL